MKLLMLRRPQYQIWDFGVIVIHKRMLPSESHPHLHVGKISGSGFRVEADLGRLGRQQRRSSRQGIGGERISGQSVGINPRRDRLLENIGRHLI